MAKRDAGAGAAGAAPERVFVDTSVWIAHVDAADPAERHAPAVAALRRHERRLVTSSYVFDETVTRCARKFGLDVAIRVGETLLDARIVDLIEVEPLDEVAAWKLFREQTEPRRTKESPASFTDCTSFVLMRRLGLTTALAFDRHFAAEGFHVPTLAAA